MVQCCQIESVLVAKTGFVSHLWHRFPTDHRITSNTLKAVHDIPSSTQRLLALSGFIWKTQYHAVSYNPQPMIPSVSYPPQIRMTMRFVSHSRPTPCFSLICAAQYYPVVPSNPKGPLN